MAWPALAWGWVALAFLRRDPRLFAKTARPALRRAVAVLLAPYLAFVYALFHAKRFVLRREPAWNLVVTGLYLGRRPLPGEIPDDAELVVDLSAELPPPRGLAGRRYRCLPVLNRLGPDPQALAALVADLAPDPSPMLIHCIAGKGRSATLAAALLIARGLAHDVDEAEAILQKARPGVHLHPKQRAVVEMVDGDRGAE